MTVLLFLMMKKKELRLVLLNNVDVFSWNHSDMLGISPTMASHKLNIIPMARPVKQKVRCFHLDRHQIIQTEVDNLLKVGFIREVKYPDNQCGGGPKEMRKVASMRGLHYPQRSMPKG